MTFLASNLTCYPNNTTASTPAPSTMFEHLDTTTTDCLQSFHDGVAAAQKELAKEQQRLASLERSLTATKERNNGLRRDKSDAERRIEALTTECARIRSANVQYADSARAVDLHIAAVRGPRQDAATVTKAHDASAAELRASYIQHAQAFLASALTALHPVKRPTVLEGRLNVIRGDVIAARARVATLRAASNAATTAPAAAAADISAAVIPDPVEEQLAALQTAHTAARNEHQTVMRTFVAERGSLRERVRAMTKASEEAETICQETQQRYNTVANEVGGTPCLHCNGPLWTIGGDSGFE
jgi:predicted  nucleic acid-binding Zn-ribbon protein